MGALKLRQKVNFPATVTAEGGLGIDKINGRWTVSPKWEQLSLVTSLPSPATKEIWARDPASNSYYRISVQAFIDSLPQGPSGQVAVGTTTTLPAGSDATVTNSGTSTSAVLDFGLPAGADGATVLNGSGPPGSGDGKDGDFWIDTTAAEIYGPKTSGVWGSGTSLVGPQGPTGVQGTPTAGHQVSWFNSTTIQDNGAMPASGMVKSDGTKLISAAAGTDFVGATSGSAIQKANGSGGLTGATAGSDYLAPSAIGTTVLAYDAQLFSNIPQNSKSAAYTLVAGDAQKHILHPSADTTARVFTIPANSSVAFPVGTTVTFVNQNSAGIITISIATDTLRWSPSGSTGSRSLAANGVATALKITSTEWIISGTGLT